MADKQPAIDPRADPPPAAPDAAPAGNGRGSRPTAGQYVMLHTTVEEPLQFQVVVDDEDVPDEDGWPKPKLYRGGQDDAKRACIREHEDWQQLIRDGVLILAAV